MVLGLESGLASSWVPVVPSVPVVVIIWIGFGLFDPAFDWLLVFAVLAALLTATFIDDRDVHDIDILGVGTLV